MANEIKGISNLKVQSNLTDLSPAVRDLRGNASPSAPAVQVPAGNLTRFTDNLSANFTARAAAIISVINESDDYLHKAAKIVQSQIRATNRLKDALISGDGEKTERAREELAHLQSNQEELAAEIAANNRDNDARRTQNLSLSSEPSGLIRIKEVRFDSPEPFLNSPADADQYGSLLRQERAQLIAQRQELTDIRKQVAALITQAREEIIQVNGDALISFEQAEASADRIANFIAAAGAQAFLANNINESAAQALLR